MITLIPLLLALTARAHTPDLAIPPTCEDTLYYGELIERVVRTGRAPFGMVSDQTDFQGYVDVFGPRFAARVRDAGPNDTWINFGGGRGLAEREVSAGLIPSGNPRIVSISAYRPDDVTVNSPRLEFRAGQLIEEMDWTDVPLATFGSDRFGPLSYSKHFDQALAIEGRALFPNAPLFVVMQSQRTFFYENDREISLETYLNRVEGLKLDGRIETVPGRPHLLTFRLKRTEGEVRVPKLKLTGLRLMMPPQRKFTL